ncbi:MAG: hypothetical protein H7338_08930, partial [Candidatus Sericytochromatia bacterium]|nr:hypothetical protein [Candidatus Sericytochromatia bacterium]
MNGSIGGNRPGKLVPVNRSAIGRMSQPAAPASQQIGDLARQMSEGSVGNMVPLVALGKAATTLAPGLIDYVFGTSTSLTPSALQEMGSRNDKTAFFKALLPMAIASERKYGVPASV